MGFCGIHIRLVSQVIIVDHEYVLADQRYLIKKIDKKMASEISPRCTEISWYFQIKLAFPIVYFYQKRGNEIKLKEYYIS